MTGSRGGWIGALAGSAIVVLLNRPAVGWPAFSAALLTAALVFVAAPGLTTERIDTSTADTSAGTRVRTWSSGIAAIREHPLLGLGAGNFRAVVKDRGSQVDPNNLTLLTWAETGIVGLIFLAWLLVGAFRLALATASMPTGTASMASAAGAGIFTAAIAHAQFEIFWTRGVALATFMGVGLVTWAHRHAARTVSLSSDSSALVGAP
jgi:O-antigen ligase